ncbi:MAG: hypothetical protein D8M58_00925 [Calditrichaeota bacterium]|nr:MAG: hypothetical protein DWQ03_06155 [Calditrichota bacterium]MBL1203930.1 hypothetical protein [Calditrichota bacterium]NOG43763.1 hypothetical protein [Calditrichota bacterium]
MKISIIIFLTFNILFSVSYSQENQKNDINNFYSLLDSADLIFMEGGFRRSNKIYEKFIPNILNYLNNTQNSTIDRIKVLNRWYKSQQYYSKGLEYSYGNIHNFSSIEDNLAKVGIKCIQEPEDGPARNQPFVPDSDLFLKYSKSFGDSLLTLFLNIVKDEESWKQRISLIIKCENFLLKYPSTYYTLSIWRKYNKHSSEFISNYVFFEFDPGGESPCIKIKRAIKQSRFYLTVYPQGFISSMVKLNLDQLNKVEYQFCNEPISYKRLKILLKNLKY